MRVPSATIPAGPPASARPRLELSGPRLARALETLVSAAEAQGGVEAYVEALRAKSALFRTALLPEPAAEPRELKTLFAHMATVRRRIGPYLLPDSLDTLRARIARLVEHLGGASAAEAADARIAAFCAGFPDDRAHRWVRDLAAEILHNVDPERYPLMCRWVWDARTNTGALREMWHDAGPDARIDVPDGCETFLVLREELAGYLAENGFFRDVPFYVDLLTAQVYAGYISEQGDSYLRTDFAEPQDPLLHTRRLLGLDGTDGAGRTRLKAVDGVAVVVEGAPRAN